MTTDRFGIVLGLCLAMCTAAEGAAAAQRSTFPVAYLFRADDPFYQQERAYTGLSLRNPHRPVDGVRLALRESRILARAVGIEFQLVEKELEKDEDVGKVIEAMLDDPAVGAYMLDLPLDDVEQAGVDLAGRDVLLFNIRHPDDRLRGAACSPVLFHTLPSQSMLEDALAQLLAKRNWRRALVLEGENADDKRVSVEFQKSARKFGLTLDDVRTFVLSNDPRERGQNNVALLTRGTGYDVIFLADEKGEFGRYVPYNTQQARPVVGSQGLSPLAWHWTFERYGAPQLNQRFRRLAGRHMEDMDYAAWAAVKSVVEAVVRKRTTSVRAVKDYLTSAEFSLDTYKGTPGGFRSWNHQLRQPVLLATHNAVVAVAPLEGFLHQSNNLDTLGTDRDESTCRM